MWSNFIFNLLTCHHVKGPLPFLNLSILPYEHCKRLHENTRKPNILNWQNLVTLHCRHLHELLLPWFFLPSTWFCHWWKSCWSEIEGRRWRDRLQSLTRKEGRKEWVVAWWSFMACPLSAMQLNFSSGGLAGISHVECTPRALKKTWIWFCSLSYSRSDASNA